MKLSLIVLQGKPENKEIPIRLPQFVIGRDPECQLRPASPLVSKRHCALIVRESKVFLRDFESTNGTVLNGHSIKGEQELRDQDEFKVGPLAFRVKISVTSVDTPTPMPFSTKPQPAADAAKSARPADEDAVAEMLFEGGPGTPGSELIPGGSTIMEMPAPGAGATNPPAAQAPKEEPKPEEQGIFAKKAKKPAVAADAAATSNAAKAILDKYMRRPRT